MSGQPVTSGLGVRIESDRAQPPTKPPRADMWQGFGVLDASGGLVWGTLRPTEAEAAAVYRKWNPPIAGHPMSETVVKVRINIEGLPLQRELL